MTEKFAAYGFEFQIPDDWRIEFSPKVRREKGDIAFHSPENNVFYVSWGKLEEAVKHFKGLEEHRDSTIKRIKSNPDIKTVEIQKSLKETISGHDALVSQVVAEGRRGFLSKAPGRHEVWSMHLYCPPRDRYYIVYWNIKTAPDGADLGEMFLSTARTMVCH